jgi:hypothetical protein
MCPITVWRSVLVVLAAAERVRSRWFATARSALYDLSTPRIKRLGLRSIGDARFGGRAETLGEPLLFLEGDPDYYSAHGWRPAGEVGFTPPSERIPASAFHVVTLRGYDPTTMRGALIYNDSFWSHDCVGRRGTRLDRWDRTAADRARR